MKAAYCVFAAWMTSAIGAFWCFEGKYQLPAKPLAIDASTNFSKKSPGQAEASAGQITLLNFWNPECGCSDFMKPHVQNLIQRYASRVKFVTVVPCPPEDEARVRTAFAEAKINTELRVDRDGVLARKYGVAAAPAAVILSREGKVLFTGAYNVTRYCNDERSAFARIALEQALGGEPIARASTPFYGCSSYTGLAK